jgi:hypothetical protein
MQQSTDQKQCFDDGDHSIHLAYVNVTVSTPDAAYPSLRIETLPEFLT